MRKRVLQHYTDPILQGLAETCCKPVQKPTSTHLFSSTTAPLKGPHLKYIKLSEPRSNRPGWPSVMIISKCKVQKQKMSQLLFDCSLDAFDISFILTGYCFSGVEHFYSGDIHLALKAQDWPFFHNMKLRRRSNRSIRQVKLTKK